MLLIFYEKYDLSILYRTLNYAIENETIRNRKLMKLFSLMEKRGRLFAKFFMIHHCIYVLYNVVAE